MRGLITFHTAQDEALLVEVEDYEHGRPLERPPDSDQDPSTELDTGLQTIDQVTRAIVNRLEVLPDAIDSAEVQFGIRLNARMGAVVASKQTDGHFQVKLTWKRRQSEK